MRFSQGASPTANNLGGTPCPHPSLVTKVLGLESQLNPWPGDLSHRLAPTKRLTGTQLFNHDLLQLEMAFAKALTCTRCFSKYLLHLIILNNLIALYFILLSVG